MSYPAEGKRSIMNKNKAKRSISASAVLIPSFIIAAVLLSCAIYVVFRIRNVEDRIIEVNESYAKYSDYSRLLLKGSDILTDETLLYVSSGEDEHLYNYFIEAADTQTRDKAIEMLKTENADKEAIEYVNKAMALSVELMDLEYHAMKLRAVVSGTDVLMYKQVRDYELTEEEKAMSDTGKIYAALLLITGEEYESYKSQIRGNIDFAIDKLIDSTHIEYEGFNRELNRLMDWLWVVIIALIVLLGVLFIALLVSLIIPLKKCTEKLDTDESIDFKHGFSEFSRMRDSYNVLLERHKALESELRNNAQTDALTGLPNRLALNYYISGLDGINKNKSVAVLSFDVNNLKQTNDAYGHSRGDELLRTASECIIDAFGVGNGKNCFRFGGDEFAAFLIDMSEDEIISRIKKFKLTQLRYDVSIAVGYAYSESMSGISAEDLFLKADREMYADKAKTKGMTLEQLQARAAEARGIK